MSERSQAGWTYEAYGLGIWASQPISRLDGAPSSDRIDVAIHIGARPPGLDEQSSTVPWFSTPPIRTGGRPALVIEKVGSQWLRLRYDDGAEFVLNEAGTEIWIPEHEIFTLDELSSYLLGSVMGLLLRLRGCVCLHGSSVAVDGAALAIVGPVGSGKSTTAAALASRGYAVLGDDVLRVDDDGGRFLVYPGYPRIRLWPSAMRWLGTTSAGAPSLPSDWGSRRYHLALGDRYRFHPTPLPLRAIYLLGARLDDAACPTIEPLEGRAGLLGLVANSFSNLMLDRAMRARDFHLLGRLASHARVRLVRAQADTARLPALCDAILADVHGALCRA